jgi:hypothetical protein
MGVAVRKGRSIVQVVGGGITSGLQEGFIGLLMCPLFDEGRLPLGEVRPHGKIGLREKNRRTIIHPIGLEEKGNAPSAKPTR